MAHSFHIVDVFAERRWTGNQLAVVLDADDLSDSDMLRIAQEMNYSETTFVSSFPDPDSAYRVRMFTPSREISFAGHPILGTAWIIRVAPLAKEGFSPLVYLFCAETHHPENHLCTRFFFVAHGVREDPATGNGAAFLGVYLLEHGYFSESNLSLRIEQGYEINRPSLVMLQARNVEGAQDVRVGGRVIPVAQGQLL
jgi:predicted PhzF superfamily epimerase YddE/YHI9